MPFYLITYDVLSEEVDDLRVIDNPEFQEELIKLLLKLGIEDIQWKNESTIFIHSENSLLYKIRDEVDNLNVNVDYFIVRISLGEHNRLFEVHKVTQEESVNNFNSQVQRIKELLL